MEMLCVQVVNSLFLKIQDIAMSAKSVLEQGKCAIGQGRENRI